MDFDSAATGHLWQIASLGVPKQCWLQLPLLSSLAPANGKFQALNPVTKVEHTESSNFKHSKVIWYDMI